MSQIVEELSKAELDASEDSNRPSALVVSVDEFAALEERIVRAVRVVKQERQARIEAEGAAVHAEALAAQAEARAAEAESRAAQMEARAAQAESELRETEPILGALQAEIKTMKAERDHVRERVERLLGQLDALEL